MKGRDVSEDVVRKVAAVARLELADKDAAALSKELGSMLMTFKDLEGLDVKGVKPSFQPLAAEGALRPDSIEPSLPQAAALKAAKSKEKGFVKGPRVI